MSGLKIFGVAPTRTMRTLWMANELALDYELVPVSPRDGGTTSPEYLAVNPNASVPAIQDGDTTLWESLAINLYLAKKHGGDLAPRDDREHGLALQWSFWVMGNVEGRAMTLLRNRVFLPEDQRDGAAAATASAAEAELAAPLAVLDAALADRDYLLGDRFTVADLNVAAVMSWLKMTKVDLSAYGHIADWLGRCLGRKAYVAARAP